MAESRTIYKVKRFLSTLVQFGNDISSETGDRVKELIFNLVVSRILYFKYFELLNAAGIQNMFLFRIQDRKHITNGISKSHT